MAHHRARARPLHPVSAVRALWARPRLLACAAVGFGLFLLLRPLIDTSAASLTLVAWNAGAILYLLLAWRAMGGASTQDIRQRALEQDEGRLAILLLVVLAALAVLLAAGTQLAQVRDLHGRDKGLHTALAALTVITSWLFTQVLFAQHYAHDFHVARAQGAPDPLVFPGTPEPGYGDFFHFACVIGTSAQTADISFNGSGLRSVGTFHCIVAFFFNAALLSLSINLAAGLLF